MDEVTDTISASTAKLIDGITPAMKALADKFGTTVEHLYTVLCKQAIVDGVGYFIVCGICLFLMIGFGYVIKLIIKYGEEWGEADRLASYVICIIVVAICFIVCSTDAINGMKHVVNPEYYAVKEVLKNIK